MNLTLEVEDQLPEVFITGLRSSHPFHELVYHINNISKVNLVKERNLLNIKRKKQQASFNWFTLCNEDDTQPFLHLIGNSAHYIKEKNAEMNLFGLENTLEERMILLPSMQKFDFWFLHPKPQLHYIELSPLLKYRFIEAHQCRSITSFKKPEQLLIENIYYEKQN